MKFIEKKQTKNQINYGDYVLFEDKSIAIICEKEVECSIVFLEDGYFSYDYTSASISELVEKIKRTTNNTARIIKSDNIVISEI